jgi:hypothetical protein
MYIAQKTIKGKVHYVLRESCAGKDANAYRDLFELGRNPSKFIVYPGGNSYYIDEVIEEKLNALEIRVDPDALDELFWPFLRPDIKRKIDAFRHRSQRRTKRRRLTATEEETIRTSVSPFDKRRLIFLRFGSTDQGPPNRMPPVLFKPLVGKSRDEIEQTFIRMENSLKRSELKTYAYVAFNLQRFFSGLFSKKMPHVLNQDKIDHHFLEEICGVNQAIFNADNTHPDVSLHEYLIRYVIMFFDYDYQDSSLLDDLTKDFIYRHHFHRPAAPKKSVSIDAAARVFGLEKEKAATFSKRQLTRRYRNLAQKLHPDKGGSQEKFIALNDAYEALLGRIRSS